MFIHVTKAEYVGEYRIHLTFNDGAEGVVDLSTELFGEVFEPLKEKDLFKNFTLEGHTVVWHNGADFAPEFLRERIV